MKEVPILVISSDSPLVKITFGLEEATFENVVGASGEVVSKTAT